MAFDFFALPFWHEDLGADISWINPDSSVNGVINFVENLLSVLIVTIDLPVTDKSLFKLFE